MCKSNALGLIWGARFGQNAAHRRTCIPPVVVVVIVVAVVVVVVVVSDVHNRITIAAPPHEETSPPAMSGNTNVRAPENEVLRERFAIRRRRLTRSTNLCSARRARRVPPAVAREPSRRSIGDGRFPGPSSEDAAGSGGPRSTSSSSSPSSPSLDFQSLDTRTSTPLIGPVPLGRYVPIINIYFIVQLLSVLFFFLFLFSPLLSRQGIV